MRGTGFVKTKVRQSAKAAGRLIKLAVLCIAAAFFAVLFTVLFTGTVVSDDLEGSELTRGDYVLAWKPAYLFSVPRNGDLVLYNTQGNLSADELSAAVYDEDEIEMASVRGRIVVRIPEKFVPGR